FSFSSRRRHTRLQGDWSSDVCSSDLQSVGRRHVVIRRAADADARGDRAIARRQVLGTYRPAQKIVVVEFADERAPDAREPAARQIGRASCRERVEITVAGEEVRRKYV